MWSTLRKIDRGVDRLGYWVGGYVILAGFFSWVSSQTQQLRPLQLNWADYLAIGLIAASVASLLVSIGIISWAAALHSIGAGSDAAPRNDVSDKNEPGEQPVPSTAYERAKNLESIDVVLGVFRESKAVGEMATSLLNQWDKVGQVENLFSERFTALAQTARASAVHVHAVVARYPEYSHLWKYLPNGEFAKLAAELDQFALMCIQIENIIRSGYPAEFTGQIFYPHVQKAGASVSQFSAWERSVQSNLLKYRQLLAET